MARIAGFVLLTLLVAVAINYGVAWWCAWRWHTYGEFAAVLSSPQFQIPFAPESIEGTFGDLDDPAALGLFVRITDAGTTVRIRGMRADRSWREPGRLLAGEQIPDWGLLKSHEFDSSLSETGHGWPVISHYSLFQTSGRTGSPFEVISGLRYEPRWLSYIPFTGRVGDRSSMPVALLPLQPVWSGFALNMLLYVPLAAVLVAFALVAQRRLRERTRFIRWRRSECPRCRYILHAASIQCSECGWNETTAEARWLVRTRLIAERRAFLPRPVRRALERPLSLVAICIVLGLATTIAIAWWSAAFVDVFNPPWTALNERGISWDGQYARIVYRFDRDTGQWVGSSIQQTRSANVVGPTPEEVLPGWLAGRPLHPALSELEKLNPPRHFVQLNARGWPLLALHSEYRSEWRNLKQLAAEQAEGGLWSNVRPSHTRHLVSRGGIALPLTPWEPQTIGPVERSLPLIPIWSGLLINTGIFATGWFFLFPATRAVARRYLKRLHFCPHCRSDLRGRMDAGCEQCNGLRAASPIASPA